MKITKYLIPFLIITLFETNQIYGQERGQGTEFGRELNTRDDQPVREFVESKENIDIKEKASNLEISGDVRFEWRNIREKGIVLVDADNYYSTANSDYATRSSFYEQNRNLRGGHYVDRNGIPLSNNDFDVEFNIKFKYTFKKAWCFAHLQFDNPAGVRGRNECFNTFPLFNKKGDRVKDAIPRDQRLALKGSGDASFINLKRAFMGYNVWADGKQRFDIELGRRKLDDVFDSEIQFTSRFDGILLKYASAIDKVMDWYLDAAVFVVDERVNHFAYVFEIGVLNLYDSGLDIRYNFIDWIKKGRNRCLWRNPRGTKFQNSEITLTYTIKRNIFGKLTPIEFYGGFLVNHAAKGTKFTKKKAKNLGWYGGIYIGNVHKEGDWSFDVEYIVVQAQAVPENDVGSIGRGNVLDESFFDVLDGYSSERESFSPSQLHGNLPRRGNTNFVGWRFEALYGITDNLSLDVIFEFSNEEDSNLGGRHFYQDFEIEAIYAF